MGRAKLENVMLSAKSSRKDCFNKRCKGALKKMYELAQICGPGVHVIVEGEDGNIYEFHRRMSRALVPSVIANDEAAAASNAGGGTSYTAAGTVDTMDVAIGVDDHKDNVSGCIELGPNCGITYNVGDVTHSYACGCGADGGRVWDSSYISTSIPSGFANALTSMPWSTANGTGSYCSGKDLPNGSRSGAENSTITYVGAASSCFISGSMDYSNSFPDFSNVDVVHHCGHGSNTSRAGTGRTLALPPPTRPSSNPKPTNHYMFYNGRTIMDTGRPVTQELRQRLLEPFMCRCFDCSKGYSNRLFESIALDQSLPPLHDDSRPFFQRAPFMGTDYLDMHDSSVQVGPFTYEQHEQQQRQQGTIADIVPTVTHLENIADHNVKYEEYADDDVKAPFLSAYEAFGYRMQPMSPYGAPHHVNLSASMTQGTRLHPETCDNGGNIAQLSGTMLHPQIYGNDVNMAVVPVTMLHPEIRNNGDNMAALAGTMLDSQIYEDGGIPALVNPEQYKPVVEFLQHDNDIEDGNCDLPSDTPFFDESEGECNSAEINGYTNVWNDKKMSDVDNIYPNRATETDLAALHNLEDMMFDTPHPNDALDLRYQDNDAGASEIVNNTTGYIRSVDNNGNMHEGFK